MMERSYEDDYDFRVDPSINTTLVDQGPKVEPPVNYHTEEIHDGFDDADLDFTSKMDSEDGDDDLTKPLLIVKETSRCEFLRNSLVEPMVFFFMMASAMQTSVNKNVIIEKICINMFGVNATEDFCKNISANQSLEAEVQIQVTTIDMYMTIVDTIPAIFVSVFLGAFSDKHGRKLPMIFPMVGFILSTLLLGIFSYYMAEIPAHFTPLACLPRAIGGGLLALIITSLSYVSDITTAEKRTIRVASVEGMVIVAQPAGTLLSGWLYKYSYPLVYLVSCGLLVLSLLYVLFAIKDTRVAVTEKSCFSVARSFFDINNFKETVVTVCRPRECNRRRHIFMLLSVSTISLIPLFGNSAILYLYTRLKLNWDLYTFSLFSAYISFSMVSGLIFIAIILVGKLKTPDLVLGVVGLLASITASTLLGLVNSPLMMYLICVPMTMTGGVSIAIRSQVSKLVPREEQGKVFSVLGTVDTVMPLVATLLYTTVYNSTVGLFAGTAFMMSAGILVFPLIIIIIVFIDMRSTTRLHL